MHPAFKGSTMRPRRQSTYACFSTGPAGTKRSSGGSSYFGSGFSNSSSLAMLAAMRRASPQLSSLAAIPVTTVPANVTAGSSTGSFGRVHRAGGLMVGRYRGRFWAEGGVTKRALGAKRTSKKTSAGQARMLARRACRKDASGCSLQKNQQPARERVLQR